MVLESNQMERVIFRSPDESMPDPSERLIWSKDCNYLLLVGSKFFTETKAYLPNGTRLYLLADLKDHKVYCNANQTKLPRFSTNDLAPIEFVEGY